MKIHEYNEMMSYLTRPAFNGGGSTTKPTLEDLKESGQIKTATDYKPKKPKIIKLIRDFEERNPRTNKAIGGEVIQGEDLGTREGFNKPQLNPEKQIIKSATKESRALYNDEKLVSKIIELVKKEPEDYDSVLKKINSYKNNKYKYSNKNLSNVLTYLANENRIDPKYTVDKTGTPKYVVNKRNAKIDKLINVAPDKLPTAASIAKEVGVTTTTVTNYLKKSKGEDWVEQNYGKERFKRYGDTVLRKQFLNYVLNNPVEKFTSKNIIKNTDIKTKKEANSIYSKLLADIYDKRAPNIERPVLYIDENINLKDLTKKLRSSDDFYDAYERKIGSLLLEAYDGNLDSKEYKKARNTLTAYHNLIRPLNKKYPSIAQTIEHPIPYTFLTEVNAGKDPKSLINTTILGDKENTFKSKIDEVKINLRRNLEKNPKDKKLLTQLEDMKKLETFLTKETGIGFGTVKSRFTDPRVQDLDFGAEAFGKKKIVPQIEESLNVRKNVVDFYNKFKNSDEVKKLFENAGVGVKVFRMLGGIRKGNVPLFLQQMKDILEKNPGLKDQLTQLDVFNNEDRVLLASLNNQSGTMTDVYTGPKIPVQSKEDLPYEAAAPAAVLFGKYAKPISKTILNTGKGAFKAAGSPLTGAAFAAEELLSEDPSQAVAGLQLLYPEIIRQVKGKTSPVKSLYDKALALSPNLKYAPYVSRGMSLFGAGLIGADAYSRLKQMADYAKQRRPLTEQELLDMREKETYMGGIADLFDKAYREGTPLPGRTGFADGPEDPSKRKTMKILGGLASIPLVGRFFDVAQMVEKAAPAVVEGAKNAPPYFFKLVDKIKEMGEDLTQKFATRDKEKVYNYRTSDADYDLYENLDTGSIQIKIRKGDPDFGYKEQELTLTKGQSDESAGVVPDEYDEYTVRPDDDGKLKDVEEGLEDIDDLIDELGPENISVKELQDMGYDVDRLGPVTKKKLGIK